MQHRPTNSPVGLTRVPAPMTTLRKILVPLDGSELAETVLPYVEFLAWRLDAEVLLLRAALAHVLPGTGTVNPQARAVKEAEQYLDRVLADVRRAGIRAEALIPYGPPAETILDQSEFHHADLIVMATHGRSGLSRWVYGSITERVLRATNRPLLVVRASAPAAKLATFPTIGRILVALDGSESPGGLLPPVAALASALAARIHLLRTVPPGDRRGANRDGNLHDDLGQILDWLQNLGIAAQATVRRGPPIETIVKYGAEQQAGLIAMATRYPAGPERWLLAGASVELLRASQVPVLLLQPSEAAANLEVEPPRYVHRCHNCARVTYLQTFSLEDYCLRCGFHLRACANCAAYDGIVCTKGNPSSRDICAGSFCSSFEFRAVERAARALLS